LSPRRKCGSVSLATMPGGRLFHSRAPATAKARSPTFEHCDWRTSSWSVSDDLRRRLDGISDKRRRSAANNTTTIIIINHMQSAVVP